MMTSWCPKHFPHAGLMHGHIPLLDAAEHHWIFVGGIQSLVDSPHKVPMEQCFDDFYVLAQTSHETGSSVVHDYKFHNTHLASLTIHAVFDPHVFDD